MWSQSIEVLNPYEAILISTNEKPTKQKKTFIQRLRHFLIGYSE